jgi:NAD(P)-dependent dehydrogenase (short-subunit alcohol dehydrogenase family)
LTRILVLGGYGGFGGRISRRLVAQGHEVLVAGRDPIRARSFCGADALLVPVGMDRAEIGAALDEHRPAILVDASGPFQAMDYRVPQACIDAGIHYLDIADGRDFVCGIGVLDAAARAAGVAVVSGASSVPALSGAVVRHLVTDMTRVSAVEMAISASSRAAAGPAVATSILSQVGQPMQIWQGKRWLRRFGWQGLRKERFQVSGQPAIEGRLVGLVDVPDLALLPDRLAGRPAIAFRAGTELGVQNFGLWLASWLVRCGLLRSLTPLAPWLQPLQRLTAHAGTDRSAMVVRIFGWIGKRRLERRWTLIANDGDGPEIPTLSIAPLIDQILAGGQQPGARDAGKCLTLADYQPAFNGLSIVHQAVDIDVQLPLYARVTGAGFDALPPAVHSMHDILRDGGASGRATVTGAGNLVAAVIARIVGFPRSGTYALHVEFTERDGLECWTRDFEGNRFLSRLSQRGPWLVERFGLLRFGFDLASNPDGLTMVMRRWWLGAIPLPLALAPRSRAREWEEEGKFYFDVPIALPLIGKLVHYRGWLIKA